MMIEYLGSNLNDWNLKKMQFKTEQQHTEVLNQQHKDWLLHVITDILACLITDVLVQTIMPSRPVHPGFCFLANSTNVIKGKEDTENWLSSVFLQPATKFMSQVPV